MRFLTNSEMRMYQRCKRRWWLSQYRGLSVIGESDFGKPFGIGNRVHAVLERYYSPEDNGDPMERLAQSIKEDLEKFPEHQEAITKEGELVTIMLEGYFEWLADTGEDQALTVLEAERPRMARLESGRDVFLLAKLDARVRHDELGERISLDHKTVASLDAMLPDLRLNTQALTQTLIERLLDAEEDQSDLPPAGTLFNMLKKVKRTVRARPPFFTRHFVRHTDSELRNHWRHVVRLADEIEETEIDLERGKDHQMVVPPNPTKDCHWDCEFFHLCPMLDNEADRHEQYIASRYHVVDPLQRYSGLIGAEDTLE